MGSTPASSHFPPHFPTTHTFPTFHPRSEFNYQELMVSDWLDKGIIILQCGKMYVCSVGSEQDGKVGSVAFFPSPICKESSLPCNPQPPKSFLLPIKHVYWHRAGCRQWKGFYHYLDPVHQVAAGFFPLWSGFSVKKARTPWPETHSTPAWLCLP